MFDKLRKKLALRQIGHYAGIDGWLTEAEALGLYNLARKLPPKATVVEIGSWQGKSTYCLAKGLGSGKVYAIDPFNADAGLDEQSKMEYAEKGDGKNLMSIFQQNMRQYGVLQKIVTMKGYSAQYAADFERINLLFIDGDHSIAGCQSDFELYAGKIVRGGFLAFHDYYKDRKELGPTHVIQNFVLKNEAYRFYAQHDSLWIAKKLA